MSRPRCALHWLRAAALFAFGGLWLAKRSLRAQGAIVVLAFHRILQREDLPRTNSLAGMILEARTFARLSAYVARCYEAVSIGRIRLAEVSPSLRLAFTFDDGWEDTCTEAFPVAAALGIPLTIFVCPGLIGMDTPFWPENLAALIKSALPEAGDAEMESAVEMAKAFDSSRRMRLTAIVESAHRAGIASGGLDSTMSWEQVLELSQSGISIGSHTQTHQILTCLPRCESQAELRASKAAIESLLAQPCLLFSYPNGNHSEDVRQMVRAAGYQLAFSMEPGAWNWDSDRFAIPRINIAEDGVTGPNGGFSRLRFDYTVFWRAWRANRRARRRKLHRGGTI